MNNSTDAQACPRIPLLDAIEADMRARGRWEEPDAEPSPEREAAHEAIFVAMASAASRLDAAAREHVATAPTPHRQCARVRRAVTRPKKATADPEPPRRAWIDPIDFRGLGVDVEVL